MLAIARRHGLKVVEDAAHALPTTCGGAARRHAGQRRHRVQLLRQQDHHHRRRRHAGDARRGAGAARAQVMRLHGMNRDAFDRFTAKVPSWYYEVVAPGFKYNLTDIAAALGLHQLKKAHAFQQRRAAIAARYDAALRRPAADHCRRSPRPATGTPGTCTCCAWPTTPASTRDRFIERLFDAGHRLQRALHPAAPAPLLARPLRACSRRCSRTASTPTSSMLSLPIYTPHDATPTWSAWSRRCAACWPGA